MYNRSSHQTPEAFERYAISLETDAEESAETLLAGFDDACEPVTTGPSYLAYVGMRSNLRDVIQKAISDLSGIPLEQPYASVSKADDVTLWFTVYHVSDRLAYAIASALEAAHEAAFDAAQPRKALRRVERPGADAITVTTAPRVV